MNAKYRFIDRKGRLTIPYALRVKHGITQNTLFAVRENDDGTLSLSLEKEMKAKDTFTEREWKEQIQKMCHLGMLAIRLDGTIGREHDEKIAEVEDPSMEM